MWQNKGAWTRGSELWDSGQELYGGNWWKLSVILVGLFVQIHFGVNSQVLVTRTFLLFLLKERNLCHEKIYDMLLGSRERSESTFLHLWFFKHLQLKITNMPKCLILEWHFLNPFILLWTSNLLTILFTLIFVHIICSKWKANEIIHCNCNKKSCCSFISVFYCLCNIQSFLIFSDIIML